MSEDAVRYAIYLAPPPDSALWRFGSRVIGYDAARGVEVDGFAPGGWSPGAWRAMTAEPRRYGFHATLKAPFRLMPGTNAEELISDLERFARTRSSFEISPLKVSVLSRRGGGGFVAFTATRRSEELAELERETVRRFARFAAPLSATDRARRKPEQLSPRQLQQLDDWGYPYVFDDFRLHFTLTNFHAEADSTAAQLASIAEEEGIRAVATDAIVLFRQAGAASRFRIARRFPFGASQQEPLDAPAAPHI